MRSHHRLCVSPFVLRLAALFITACSLTACGGGGGGVNSTTRSAATLTCTQGTATCTLSSLDNLNASGVWVANNTTGVDQTVAIDISNLRSGQAVVLSLTNQSPDATAIATPANFYAPLMAAPLMSISGDPAQVNSMTNLTHRHHDYLRSPVKAVPAATTPDTHPIKPRFLVSPSPTSTFALNDTKTWRHVDNSLTFVNMPATLRASARLSDGKWLHIWVHNSEWEDLKVNAAIVEDYKQAFTQSSTGIYDRVTALTNGRVWGTHSDSELLPEDTQDIHVVLGNLTPNLAPYGTIGYYYALNNYKKTTLGCLPSCTDSNEALVFFLDSETTYLGGSDGQSRIKSALMHELVHMVNFYGRQVQMGDGYMFDTWLEEMTAMMMQDLLETSFSIPHIVSTVYMPDWVATHGYQCSPFVFDSNTGSRCFSYRVGSVYGAYLIRQYGLTFYQKLLAARQTNGATAGIAAIDDALSQTQTGASALAAASQMNATAAMLQLSNPPAQYQFPRVTGINYDLPELPLSSLLVYQSQPLPNITSIPQGGSALRQFTSTSNRWSTTLTVPSNSSLSIVVQP